MTFTLKTRHLGLRRAIIDRNIEADQLDDVCKQRLIPDRLQEVITAWRNYCKSNERIELKSTLYTYTLESE